MRRRDSGTEEKPQERENFANAILQNAKDELRAHVTLRPILSCALMGLGLYNRDYSYLAAFVAYIPIGSFIIYVKSRDVKNLEATMRADAPRAGVPPIPQSELEEAMLQQSFRSLGCNIM